MKKYTFFVIVAAFAALTVPVLLTGCELIEGFLNKMEAEKEAEKEEEELSSAITFASGDNSAIDQIQAAKTANKTSITITLGTGGEETVQFGQEDIPPKGLVLDGTNSPANVTIDGKGYTVDLIGAPTPQNDGQPIPFIAVKDGVTLTLKNITFKGLRAGATLEETNADMDLIRVYKGGRLIMEDGVVIEENDSVSAVVYVDGGTFTMNGGEIRNSISSMGGVFVGCTGNDNSYGVFTMNGGTISGHTATGVDVGGGGVTVANYGTFEMKGGTISGNTTSAPGGGVYVGGSNGFFIKTGGIIYGATEDMNANTSSADAKTHAVFATGGSKYRTTTADGSVKLYINNNTGDTTDPSPGGVGDTSANWGQ
jgi:hypothetical protein